MQNSYEVTRENAALLASKTNCEKLVGCIEDEVARLERVGFGGFESMLEAIRYCAAGWATLDPDMSVYRGGSHVAVHYRTTRVLLIAERRAAQ